MSSFFQLFLENLVAPVDWREERRGSTKAHRGQFRVYDRKGALRDRVRGEIAIRDARTAEVYLYDPPRYMAQHQHGRCLQLLRPGERWYKLHFERPAYSFGDACVFVESLLSEAYCLTH